MKNNLLIGSFKKKHNAKDAFKKWEEHQKREERNQELKFFFLIGFLFMLALGVLLVPLLVNQIWR